MARSVREAAPIANYWPPDESERSDDGGASDQQFQRRQGDARDFPWAWAGGDGTGSAAEPGPTLASGGTCAQELWPDDEKHPRADEHEMARDALAHRLPADVSIVHIDDLKKVLTAGYPVVLGMNTGPAFGELGRDGVVHAAEEPSGRHGRHAMLMVGYVGNYYIVKNSWGADWGDGGYCYIPKKVLAAADPEFEAVLVRRGAESVAPSPPAANACGAPSSDPSGAWREPPTPSTQWSAWPTPAPSPSPSPIAGLVRCAACNRDVRLGRFCEAACGKQLAATPAPSAKCFCVQCGTALGGGDRFCFSCGARTA